MNCYHRNRSDDALQNDLVDLLGFEKFDLIEVLLRKRLNIVQAHKRVYVDQVYANANANNTNTNNKFGNQMSKKRVKKNAWWHKYDPTNALLNAVTSDVVVHTETEKKIKKTDAKRRKKINKNNNCKS